MDACLRLAGAARGELPDRDVVVRDRRCDEIAGLPRDQRRRTTPRRPGARCHVHSTTSSVGRASAGGRGRDASRSSVTASTTTTTASGVVEVVRVVLWLQERVDLGGHCADLLHRVPGRDELHRVGEREEHALLRLDAEFEQRVANAIGEVGELRVGDGARRSGERGSAAAALRDDCCPGRRWRGSGRRRSGALTATAGDGHRADRLDRGSRGVPGLTAADQVDQHAGERGERRRPPRGPLPRQAPRSTRDPSPWRGSRSARRPSPPAC